MARSITASGEIKHEDRKLLLKSRIDLPLSVVVFLFPLLERNETIALFNSFIMCLLVIIRSNFFSPASLTGFNLSRYQLIPVSLRRKDQLIAHWFI